MDPQRFDSLARLVAVRPNRRQMLKLLGGLIGGAAGASLTDPAVASSCPAGCCDCSHNLGGGPGCCLCCSGSTPHSCCTRLGVGCGLECCGDNECADGATYQPGGVCVCTAGTTRCGNYCFDIKTNTANCGGCGTACAAGQDCCHGVCADCPFFGECAGLVCTCPADLPALCTTHFGQICVDLNKGFGDSFCGGCDALDCLSGIQHCCSGKCIETYSDIHNCGGCGETCFSPPGGHSACCASGCVDLSSDPLHCGGCFGLCPPNANCVKGRCTLPRCPRGRCGPGCICTGGGQCINGHCVLPR